MTQIKSSLATLTDIGDIAIDPSTFTLNTLTPDGIKQISVGTGVLATELRQVVPQAVMEDNRPTVAEKPLAIRVSVSDFDRLSHNDDVHLIRLIQNANDKLRHAIQADTRCADCRNLEVKVEEFQDLARASSSYVLTTACRLRKSGITKVVCPDGRVSDATGQSLYQPEVPVYVPEVKPKANPDRPTGFDDAW